MIVLSKKNKQILQELKDYSAETYFHSLRVKSLAGQFIKLMIAEGAVSYSQSEIDYILTGAILHDVGKLFVKNYVLTKKSHLTEGEWDDVKMHTKKGAEVVCEELQGKEREIVRNICLYHHEKVDGKGYMGMTELPLYVQIVSICDVYDALTSDRIYADACTPEKALSIIQDGRCGFFSKNMRKYLKKVVLGEQE